MNQQILDPVSVGLGGTLLVEASAGTGKTWTIGALLLRFLLEEGLALPELLVLTFTEAATAELRDRMRQRLEHARRQLEDSLPEGAPVDLFLRELCQRLEREGRWNGPEALVRLRRALSAFDEASIFTIHGFCQRVLAEDTLALGMPPGLELGDCAAGAMETVALDELRRWWHRLPGGFLDWLAACQGRDNLLEPIHWTTLAALRDSHADASLAASTWTDLDEVQAQLERLTDRHHMLAAQAAALFEAAGIDALRALVADSALHGGSYKRAWIADELAAAVAWLKRGAAPGAGGKTLKYAAGHMATRVNKGGAAPRHECFEALEELQAAERGLLDGYGLALDFLQRDCLERWPGQAAALRLERRQLDFNDLLTKVRAGLAGPDGPSLSAQLRQRWRAALVDEFQDTDPVQAEIFRRIFRDGGLPLILVGDPKQAIYGFRGADLHTYLAAARSADARAGLEVNWRSDAGLIQAFNLLFSRERFPSARGPFLREDIVAQPVRASARAGEKALVLEGRTLPALLALQAEASGLNKSRAVNLVCRHLASSLRRLLRPAAGSQTGWRKREGGGLEPVQGRDIAVLVRTNRQGRAVADALAAEGLACVQVSPDSVWHSAEADELLRVLTAMARPADTGASRALLAGTLALAMGAPSGVAVCSPELLVRLQRELHRALQESRGAGLATAVALLLERLAWPEAMLGLRRGERRLVNWRHLLELLRQEEGGGWTDPAEMSARLQLKRAASASAREAELRLESEENLVRVLTQHKCKGLEFPLVVCPFLWAGTRGGDEFGAALLHQEDGRPLLVPHSRARPLAVAHEIERADEALSESLRLAYVAMTRAHHQVLVYSVAGKVSRGNPGALNWLLLPDIPPADMAPGTNAAWKGLAQDGAALQAQAWLGLAAQLSGHLGMDRLEPVSPAAHPDAAEELGGHEEMGPRPFQGVVRSGDWISSFTSLMTGVHDDTRRDEWFGPEVNIAAAEEPAGSLGEEGADGGDWRAAFPRGARSGNCLHLILEQADFGALDTAALEATCLKELRAHGLDPDLAPGTARWLRDVLESPLDEGGFRLAGLRSDEHVAELEFHLPVAGLPAGRVNELLIRHGLLDPDRLGATDPALRDQLDRSARAGVRALPAGFLKGYIDLCCTQEGRWWVLDWKSNRLATHASGYTRDLMMAEMARSGYFIQALLYLTALHRHLGRTLTGYRAETHLGGLRYLFLRGVDPRWPGRGVFTDRPPLALVLELDEALGGHP